MIKLSVIWKSPKDGKYRTIGELWRNDNALYCFGYKLDNLSEAKQAGFYLLLEFPEERGIDNPYVSKWLFATFSQRIPSPKRLDYDDMMHGWGVPAQERHDPLLVLAKSKGKLITDKIEVEKTI